MDALIIIGTIGVIVTAIVAVVLSGSKSNVIAQLQSKLRVKTNQLAAQEIEFRKLERKYHDLHMTALKIQAERDKLRHDLKRGATQQSASTTFTRDEFNSLLQLCHPDKHGGKESAVKMTQMLLSRRPN
jgi:hypothetical protein